MNSVALTVRFSAKPDAENAAIEALSRLAASTRDEPGCLEFRLHLSHENRSAVLLYERWRDQAALAAHETTPHIRAFQMQAPHLVAWPPEVSVWRPVTHEGP
jgi:quinol monooxygenase YgiN